MAEIYYRFQVMKVLSVTPDMQLIIDPALNHEEGSVWVFGLLRNTGTVKGNDHLYPDPRILDLDSRQFEIDLFRS